MNEGKSCMITTTVFQKEYEYRNELQIQSSLFYPGLYK